VAEDEHVPITDHHAPVYERVGPYMFEFSAGSFFQNNNSILVPLLEYVREAIFPTATATTITATPSTTEGSIPPPTHLVDTYCGSGLFGISLSAHFERIAGVEISDQSIKAAKRNAEINGLQDKTSWLVGKAEEIFGGLEKEGFRGMESCVVVDVSLLSSDQVSWSVMGVRGAWEEVVPGSGNTIRAQGWRRDALRSSIWLRQWCCISGLSPAGGRCGLRGRRSMTME
jgi:hypothetical protein